MFSSFLTSFAMYSTTAPSPPLLCLPPFSVLDEFVKELDRTQMSIHVNPNTNKLSSSVAKPLSTITESVNSPLVDSVEVLDE